MLAVGFKQIIFLLHEEMSLSFKLMMPCLENSSDCSPSALFACVAAQLTPVARTRWFRVSWPRFFPPCHTHRAVPQHPLIISATVSYISGLRKLWWRRHYLQRPIVTRELPTGEMGNLIFPILKCGEIICFKDFIYLFIRDTESEAETQAEGEAGSLQGAWCGTWSQDPRITTWAKGRLSTTEPPRYPWSQTSLILFEFILTNQSFFLHLCRLFTPIP